MNAAGNPQLSPVMPILHFALDSAHRGFPVFPCSAANKAPLTEADVDPVSGKKIEGTGGFRKASCDPEQIKAWWEKHPNAMIGIPTGARSGIWAVDPDAPKPPSNIDGRQNWAELTAQNGGHPHTHIHNTPGGGQHIVFKYRADKPVTNREGWTCEAWHQCARRRRVYHRTAQRDCRR
jgi:Bifunctional DNA primase/polymerase, N-terminal